MNTHSTSAMKKWVAKNYALNQNFMHNVGKVKKIEIKFNHRQVGEVC